MSAARGGHARPAAVQASQARRVCRLLGHTFSDAALLRRALTHRSASAEHNERLEFLGDAVIELVVTEWLYRSLPDRSEGELTRLRARVVRRESLAELARELGLGETLSLGGGELKSGGRNRDSILADAFEALIGALYLDAGLETCRRRLLAYVEPRMGDLEEVPSGKDPKTCLQEWLQGKGLALPRYEVVGTDGAEHAQHFHVECTVASVDASARGSGSSRRRAEQAAAQALLAQLEAHD
jgi:ribonuclease-3